MTHELLRLPPFGPRDDKAFVDAVEALTQEHLVHCAPYAKIWSDWEPTGALVDVPFLHVGLFKHLHFVSEKPGLQLERVLLSSSTSGQSPSRIQLDKESSALQSESSLHILKAMLGEEERPLLILDHVRSLRQRGQVSARIAAAMSLRPLASELHFLLAEAQDPASVKWDVLAGVLAQHDALLVYGFTWILWFAWGAAAMPDEIRAALKGKQIHFVHSGGWKKLEAQKISPTQLEESLLQDLAPGSSVLDFYGLVEQVGIIYPMCAEGFRHVPAWADVLVRDPLTLAPLEGQPGQLQLLNVLARGAPYHSVLTEDMGVLHKGPCPCGRAGRRFTLRGRMPKAEVRGCANV